MQDLRPCFEWLTIHDILNIVFFQDRSARSAFRNFFFDFVEMVTVISGIISLNYILAIDFKENLVKKDTPLKNVGRPSGRFMGLDIGEKTIGIAFSDELGYTAQPFDTLQRKNLSSDLAAIGKLVEEQNVSTIVIGLPKNMNGTLGRQARLVTAFSKKLEQAVKLPLLLWDERLSTVAANRVLLEADMSRVKRKKHVDKLAAAIILQGFLDSDKT